MGTPVHPSGEGRKIVRIQRKRGSVQHKGLPYLLDSLSKTESDISATGQFMKTYFAPRPTAPPSIIDPSPAPDAQATDSTSTSTVSEEIFMGYLSDVSDNGDADDEDEDEDDGEWQESHDHPLLLPSQSSLPNCGNLLPWVQPLRQPHLDIPY